MKERTTGRAYRHLRLRTVGDAWQRLSMTLIAVMVTTVTLYAQGDIPGLTYNAEGEYYEIPDAAALNTLSAFVNAGHNCAGMAFKQTKPITLTGDFTPIGEHQSGSLYVFSGTYDGNSQTISGLNVSGNYPCAGLFGYLYKATVKNVWLVNPVISSTRNSGELYAGALVGRTHGTKNETEYSTITNCIVISPTVGFTTESDIQYAGAIIGDVRGSFDQITNCYFYDTQHAYTAIGDPETMTYYPTVAQAHHITLGNHVVATNDITVTNIPNEKGFVYNKADYYRDGFEIELSSTGLVAEIQEGYCVGFSVDGGQTWLDNDILNVGTDCHDATVIASNTAPIDWEKVSDGSDGAPYLIKNTKQMELLAHRVNSGKNDYSNKYFELDGDLLYSQEVADNYTAIGTADHPFRGNFNGYGHVVAFVNIDKADADYQGLFGYTAGATISDIQFTDSEITGNNHVGGIVGYADGGTVKNCLLFRDAVTATTGGVIIGSRNGTTLTANFHNGSTYNNQNTGVSTSEGDVNGGAFGARKIILANGIAVDKDVTDPANGFLHGSQKYFCDGLELTVSYTDPLDPNYSVSFVLNETPIENGVLTVTPDCNGKTISPVFTVEKVPQIITYMKADGTTAEHEAIPLDGSETSLKAGEWYYVGQSVAYDHTLNLQDGDITIILCDGKSMAFGDSNHRMNKKCIYGFNSNLVIYGQSLDASTAGTLSIYRGDGIGVDYDCIETKTYTQYSGNVTISTEKQYSIYVNDFLLAGGSLTLNSPSSTAIYTSYDLIVSGGILEARTQANNAVLESSGDIVLGWTRKSDRIYATSYDAAGKVRIADGKVLKDANTSDFFTGVIDNPADIAAKTLTPAACVTFVCTPSETTIDPVFLTPDETVTRPADPVLDGHDFLGWYTFENLGPDGTPYDFDTAVNGNLKLYGKWSGLEWNYTITYDLTGGELPEGKSNPTAYTYKSDDIILVNPVRTGYTFTGWTGTDLTEPTMAVTIAKGSLGNRTYTATWTPTVYPIHYVLNGGELNEYASNPTSYTIESDYIELSNPSREGYFFLGWTGTDLDEPSEYVYIPTGSYGERTYTANWKEGKDFTACTAVVANPIYNDGYFAGSFYYIGSPIIKIWDSEGNLLADDEYRFDNMESYDYPEYYENPCTRVGEHCRVVFEGMGDWIGKLEVDVVILEPEESALSAVLSDTGNNDAVLTSLANTTVSYITLNKRTLHKDGKWNTLCLPFDTVLEGSPLEGATAMVLRPSDSGLSGTTLNLYYDAAPTTIPAGTPFIVKWTGTGEDITSLVFSGVTIDNSDAAIARKTQASQDGYVSFCGTFNPISYETENKNVLLFDDDNTLHYAGSGASLRACRAFFLVDPTQLGGASLTDYHFDFGNGETLTGTFVNGQRGDANGDGQVTLADAVAVVNYILGNPSENFNASNADVDGNGSITITDAVRIVDMLLNQ